MRGMNTVSWGILGCGNVTEVKSGPAFHRVPHSSLAAVMRRDGTKAEDYARRHGVPRWYSDAEALIRDPGVNAVYIATPPGFHCELALKVAEAGKPCYVEKPMARNAEECLRMVDAFRKAGQPLFVAYYRRGLPHFRRVKEVIDSGELGRLRGLNYFYSNDLLRNGVDPNAWRYQPEISGGGLFWDLGSHALDLFDWWLGPLEATSGHCLRRTETSPVEDRAALTAVTNGGVSVAASWNFLSPFHVDRVELTFDDGDIRCPVFGSTTLEFRLADGSTREEDHPHGPHIQENLISSIVEAIRTGSPAPSTGESAMRTNQVMDRVAGRCGQARCGGDEGSV